MIGHIAALNTSAAYAPVPLGASEGVNSPSVGGSVSGPPSAQTVMSTQINAQVARLLQGIGGGAENNQLLQLMIGLMILITLLQVFLLAERGYVGGGLRREQRLSRIERLLALLLI